MAYQFVAVASYLGYAGHLKINLHPSGWSALADRMSFLDDCGPELYTGNPIFLAALAELPLSGRRRQTAALFVRFARSRHSLRALTIPPGGSPISECDSD